MNAKILERIQTLQRKAAGDIHTGAMIALVPSVEYADKLALQGDSDAETPDELHITVAFLGESAAISEAQKMALMASVQRMASETAPFYVKPFAVNVFNPNGDEPCLVLGMGGGDLDSNHDRVWNILDTMKSDGSNLNVPDNHAPWVPHMTLKYFKNGKLDAQLIKRVAKNLPEEVLVDRIRVAFGNNNIDFKLEGEPDQPVSDSSEVKPTTVYEKSVDSSKCKFCDRPSTRKLVGGNGKTIYTCVEHTDDNKEWFSAMTEEDNVPVEKKVVRHVRTPAGERRYKEPIGSVIVGHGRKLPHVKVTGNSDYEGWVRAEGSDGKKYEVGQEDGKWYATGLEGGWDDIVAEGSSEEDVYKKLDAHIAKGASTPSPNPSAPKNPPIGGNVGFKKVRSEYEGYDQYEGDNGKTLWSYKEGNQHHIVDEDNNIVESVRSDELLGALHRLLKKDSGTSEPKKPTSKKPTRPYENVEEAVKAAQEDPAAFVNAMAAWLFPIGSGVDPAERKRNMFHRNNLDALVDRIKRGADHETAARDIRQWAKLSRTVERGRLNQIAAGLEQADLKNKDKEVLSSKPKTSEEIQQSIRSAYARSLEKLGAKPGDFVKLSRLRNEMSGEGLSREDVDKQLLALSRDPKVNLVPESNQKILTDEDRAAALQMGNQDKHLIAIMGDDRGSSGSNKEPKPSVSVNPNGSKVGPGGQGHIPNDPDKVELTKPKDLDSGMMVNIGEGGWKYIGQVVKVTNTSPWGGRGGQGSLEGQYKIFDPWGEQIAIMSPNSTVEVDKGVPQRADMRPKMTRKPHPSREVYFEPAEGVRGQQNPFEDSYPDFDPNSFKIYGKPVRYERRISNIKMDNGRGHKIPAPETMVVVRRERDKDGNWTEKEISRSTFTGTLQERNQQLGGAEKQFLDLVTSERAKAGVSNYKPWKVPPQPRKKAKVVPYATQVSNPNKPVVVSVLPPSSGVAPSAVSPRLRARTEAMQRQQRGQIFDYEKTKPKSKLPTAAESEAAARLVRQTPEGRDLYRGVLAYQQKWGEVAKMQEEWNKLFSSARTSGNVKRDAELRAIARAIREAPQDDRDLYRGFSLMADVDVNKWLGTTQRLPITSFSSDRAIARSFKGATLKHKRRQVNVTLKGGPSRRALPIEVFGIPKYAYEREWLTAGAFKITKVEQRQGHWYIEMEQVAVFDERNGQ